MNLTITTDASFSKTYNVGTYAFWISCKGGPFKKSGVLREMSRNSSHAEMKCICNALAFTLKLSPTITERVKSIHINTDSMNSIHLFSGDKEAIRRYKLTSKACLRVLAKYNELIKMLPGRKIIFTHIKAHTHTNTPAYYVNGWCDAEAKSWMHIKLNHLKTT